MKHSTPVIVFLAASIPAINAFGYGYAGCSGFRPSLVLTPTVARIRSPAKTWSKDTFSQSFPRYELTDNEEEFKVAIDVPGVEMEDIQVGLENDDEVLTIRGKRSSGTDRYEYKSEFYKSFTINASVDIEKFSAQLKNGVLTVSAPKDMSRIQAKVRNIPITSFDAAPTVPETMNGMIDVTNEHKEGEESKEVTIDVEANSKEEETKEEESKEEESKEEETKEGDKEAEKA